VSERLIRSSRARLRPRIDLTALVDGVFNLLIFFAVTSTMAGAQAGLALKLPQAATAQRLKGHVMVGIAADGAIYVDAARVDLAGVGAAVTRNSGGDTDAQVVVRPDRRVAYERIVGVMDQVRLAGYHNLALAALKKRER
jgi:biopolymer transport protein ExbD